jgi:phage gp46-like protein
MAEFARDETTGDYVMQTGANAGKPAIDTTLAAPTRTRLRARRGGWMHAPNDQWGSDFHSYRKRKSTDFKDGLGESIALKALQPLVDDGRADNLEAETQFTQRGGVAIKVTLLDRQQQQTYDVKTQVGT